MIQDDMRGLLADIDKLIEAHNKALFLLRGLERSTFTVRGGECPWCRSEPHEPQCDLHNYLAEWPRR